MAYIVQIKNNTISGGTWVGTTIAAGAYHTIAENNLTNWRTDTSVMTDVGSGDLIVNNGTTDILNGATGYKWLLGDTQPLSDLGNKLAVHPSSKPIVPGKEFYLGWIGAGDDIVGHTIGAGDLLEFNLAPGTATVEKIVAFDASFGDVYVHEAYINGSGASSGDYCEGEIWASATSLQQSVNLDYVVETNRIKYAPGGAGTGTHGLAATPVLIPRSYSHDGDWDYDGTNLTPNFAGTGDYMIMDIDYKAHAYFNKLPMVNNSYGWQILTSDETAYLPSGYFIKIIANNISDTTWRFAVMIEVFREKTAI